MSEKIEIKTMEVPAIAGSEVVFLAAVCVDKDGKAAIAYNAAEGVNVVRVGKALQEFGVDLANRGTKALEGAAEA